MKTCWDNALAESFFASVKNERVHHRSIRHGRKQRKTIPCSIELFDKRRRMHSALGYRTRHQVRNRYMNSQLVA
ncbi:integrase core domain-containing protein [Mycobacterium botniense]|uniref:integrase core domain-containing protein n=1 Tax=Mycobacterium botniense TaxID=84962 RepID=UPI0013D0038F